MLVLSFMIALFSCNYTPVLPTAIIPLSLLLTIIFYIPNGIITATTSMGLVMGTPSDLISGHLLSGGPNGDGCPLDLANYSGFIATNRYF
ncbi:unnamed protein product [Rotaria magnacalcarata]